MRFRLLDGGLQFCTKHHNMLNCIDLFAGAGGFSLAATQAGFNVRLAVENDKHAAETYRRNLCDASSLFPVMLDADITSLSPEEELRGRFEIGEECDLLLGGPPCQGFSAHRINNAGINDPRNKLIHTYFDFARTFRPKAFLMENVPGMLWPRHRDYLNRFIEEGREAHYKIFEPVVLDARNYGVLQRRKRVFVLGLREDINADDFVWPPEPTHGSETACRENSNLRPWSSCRSVFAPAPQGDPNDVHMNHTRDLVEVFNNTPLNGGSRRDSGRVLACHKDHDGHKDVYGRIDPSGPAPTMTTACINPSKGRFVHPTEPHGITARQAARIQTFPDTFVFEGGLMAAGRQIGNAVPVEFGRVLIEHIKPLLQSGNTLTKPAELEKGLEPV
ncbi:DNA cytosine methyltransferase [Hoeflea sp. AS60]|uniref:DNA cytosine methyltransferase n=1 Tax=Hoeflea sp. AS60 TaxID=3135780 RepID=UPI003179FD64